MLSTRTPGCLSLSLRYRSELLPPRRTAAGVPLGRSNTSRQLGLSMIPTAGWNARVAHRTAHMPIYVHARRGACCVIPLPHLHLRARLTSHHCRLREASGTTFSPPASRFHASTSPSRSTLIGCEPSPAHAPSMQQHICAHFSSAHSWHGSTLCSTDGWRVLAMAEPKRMVVRALGPGATQVQVQSLMRC